MKRPRSRILPNLLCLAALAAGAGCRRPEELRRLPLVKPDMVTLGVEARPARRIPHENAVTWSIPSSEGGKLELAAGLSPEDTTPDLSAVFRVYRLEGKRKTLLGSRTVRRLAAPGWTDWTVVWAPHGSPAAVTLEMECFAGGKPHADPLSPPVLLAEPILVPRRTPRPRENAVIFLVDTLRADRLGCYGDRAASTPEIDRLAAEGTRVERVVSAANWTLPAHASLFTSTGVARHLTGGLRRSLGRELPTLAESFQSAGYRTLAVTNGGFVNPSFGVARGFDRYFSVDLQSEKIEASVKRAIELLRQYRDEPVFLFFHTYQVHQYPHELGVPPDKVADAALLSRLMNRKYDEEVTHTDAAFGQLRRGLDALGLASRTAIFVTSDHGEMLNDRPDTITSMVYGHSHPYLHDEENRIPLVFDDPRSPRRGRTVPGPASLLDIAPTVLETLGLAGNPSFEGVPLSRIERDPAFARNRVLVTEEPHNECLSLEQGGRKLILRPARPFRSLWWGEPYGPIAPTEAYLLSSDPLERRNVADRSSDFADLRRDADAVVGEMFPGSVILLAPAADGPDPLSEIGYTLRAASGLRSAMTFGDRQGDVPPSLDASGAARGHLGLKASALWIALEPNRPRDLVQIRLDSDGSLPIRLGDGETVPAGRTRFRWEALQLRAGARPGRAFLLYASSLDPVRKENPTPDTPLAAENLRQLRSLGYLNMPWKDSRPSSPSAGAPIFDSPGPGIVVVDLERGASR